MEIPMLYYIIGGAVLIIVVTAAAFALRSSRKKTPAQNPYVEALKSMIGGNDDKAFLELQTAVKSGFAPTDAYIRLGKLLRERGQVNKALQIHQSLTVKTNLSKSEKNELFLNIAEDYAKMGNSRRSIEVLQTAIRSLHLKDPNVFISLAKHYHIVGEHDAAYGALKDARKHGVISDRELALYLVSAAEPVLEKGSARDARRLLQRAIKHDPNCAPCLLMLGDLARDGGNLDEAIERWKQVAVLSPELAGSVLHKLESSLYEKGRFGDIEQIYASVREARLGDEAANLSLAAFYKKQGRGEEAIQLLEEYLAVHPESIRGSLFLTSLYTKYRDGNTLDQFLDQSVKETWQPHEFVCSACQFRSDKMRWHCPRCSGFDSFSTNHDI